MNDHDELRQSELDTDGPQDSWNNPPFACRLVLVAGICGLHGVLAGLLVEMLANWILELSIGTPAAAVTGAMACALVGLWLEASDSEGSPERSDEMWDEDKWQSRISRRSYLRL